MNLMNVAEIKISYSTNVPASERITITSSYKASSIFTEVFNGEVEYRENMYVLLLNRANKVLGVSHISMGGVSGTVCDPKILFQVALKAHASGIILCHNHPSGNRNPSDADERLTRKIQEGGKILDIPLLDHIILTPDNEYFSFADEGLM